jgi:hypothetical protein
MPSHGVPRVKLSEELPDLLVELLVGEVVDDRAAMLLVDRLETWRVIRRGLGCGSHALGKCGGVAVDDLALRYRAQKLMWQHSRGGSLRQHLLCAFVALAFLATSTGTSATLGQI